MTKNLDIPAFLDRRPIVWSYSLLHCFDDICPYQGEARYITRSIKFVETEEIKWGNRVHEAFEMRVGGNKPLPLEMQSWERFAAPYDGRGARVEQWFGITADGHACDSRAANVWGRGKVDLHIVNGEAAFVNDWKTGNSKYEDPFELEVSALLINARYPQLKKIIGQYTWLKDERTSQTYDLSNTAATWKRVCDIMTKILAWRAAGDYPKNRTPLCGWCQRFDCENNSNPSKPNGQA